MKVLDLTHPSTTWSSPNLTIEEAARVMSDRGCAFLPIVEDEHTIGVVTDRDLAMALAIDGSSRDSTRVCEVMSRPVFSVSADAEGEEAVETMLANHVRRLVVHEDGRFLGVVSMVDLAGHLPDHCVTDAVHQLAEHNRPSEDLQPPRSIPELYIG